MSSVDPVEGSPASFAHRPALDGIRAVAVLVVLGFHLGISSLPGGFLGVDVFFVLSGYLITTLLLREHRRRGRINLGAFWGRRARRLLPAVLLLLTVTAIVVGRTASPTTLSIRRADLLWTLFYGANWHFIASDQSYFTSFAGASPLRHAWSLAIEEQFYLVWPLVVFGLTAWARRRRVLLAVSIAGVIASAVTMAVRFTAAAPSRAYFGTDARIHTPLVGALLAVAFDAAPSLATARPARTIARWLWPVVVVSLVVAITRVHDQSPSYYRGGSLAFALTAAAGIWLVEALPHSLPGRVLSSRPLTWIGTISYGVYLWHWPLILWLGVAADGISTRQLWERRAASIGLTLAVATASYYLIERPIRRRGVPGLRSSAWRRIAAVPLALAAVTGVLAVSVKATAIEPNSFAAQTTDYSVFDCPAGSAAVDIFAWCDRNVPPSPDAPVVAAVGDSTSRALNPGLLDVAKAKGWHYIQAGQNGCSLLPLMFPSLPGQRGEAQGRRCAQNAPLILSGVKTSLAPDVWILSDRYPISGMLTAGGEILAPKDPRHQAATAAALHAVLAALTADGAQVVIVAQPPVPEPIECLKKRTSACKSKSHTPKDPRTVGLNAQYRRAAEAMPGRVAYVRIDDVLCPDGSCPPVLDGVLTRYDGLHYTATFSRRIVPTIIERATRAGVVFEHRVRVAHP